MKAIERFFRAKGTEDHFSQWYFGNYLRLNYTTYVFEQDYQNHPENTTHYIVWEKMMDWGLPNTVYKTQIDPETLCEYLNICDITGTRIFENDILELISDENNPLYAIIRYDEYNTETNKDIFGFYLTFLKDKKEWFNLPIQDLNTLSSFKVIGNIFDNKELYERDC